MTIRVPIEVSDELSNALVARVDAGSGPGKVKIYTQTQPTTGGGSSPSGTAVLLATLTLNDPAFGSADGGVCYLNADDPIAGTAVATGSAGWARVLDSDDNVIFDGNVGTATTSDFRIGATSVVVGDIVNLVSGSIGMA